MPVTHLPALPTVVHCDRGSGGGLGASGGPQNDVDVARRPWKLWFRPARHLVRMSMMINGSSLVFRSLMLKLVLAVCGLVMMLVAPAGVSAAPPSPANVVLDNGSIWRMYHTLKPPLLQQADGQTKPLVFNVKWLDSETAPPPADWMKPEADDRAWMRGPARLFARTPYLAMLAMRGRFEVTNPAAAGDLSLAIDYYGGVIVSLNGKEVGRGNVPRTADPAQAIAEPYPMEAFLDGQGKLIVDSFRSPSPAVRTRSVQLTVPKSLLRKGTNVLAIEVVRAPYPGILLDKKPYGVGGMSKDPGLMWNTCEIRTVTLSAGNLAGVVPNVSRPGGVQVWNANVLSGDTDTDYGDPTEPLHAISIISPRNGAMFGKVVIGRDKPIKNLHVTAGDLTSGGSNIPASQVSFLYGIQGGKEILPPEDGIRTYPEGLDFLDALVGEPLKEFSSARSRDSSGRVGAVVPLWVRVKVPRNTPVGTYKGFVTVTMADAAAVRVPLEVKVLPWTIPDPQDFKTWVELIQSPDTLSVEYNVPLWSEKHFEFIARSFQLISDTGARSIYIPAIAHTNLGNAESMIRWIKRPGGKYDWDFSVMDKYLDTAQKYLGTPKLVVLQVWEVYMNTKDSTGRRFGEILDENQKETGGAPLVTFVDANGKTENGTIPKLGDPASKAIWQELISKVRERLKKRGLEKTLQLGMFTDSTPNKEDTKMFHDIAPDLAWVQQGHNAFTDLNGIAKVGYTATWWSSRFADDLDNLRSGAVGTATYKPHGTVMTSLHGWSKPRLDAYYPRMDNEAYPISFWHFLCETAITGDFYRGIGRVGADYWPCIKTRGGVRAGWVNERFIEVKGYLHDLHSYVLEPKADGPVAMNRLLAMEEGIQECEARIYIENALLHRGLAGRSPDLAKRCQEMLDDRLLFMWKALDNMEFGGWGVTAWRFQAGLSGNAWLLNSDAPGHAEQLYSLAGEVEKVVGK